MIFWKIVALLAVLALSYISLRQEHRRIKWIGMSLCSLIFIVGAIDVLISSKEQDRFHKEVLRDSTRILWQESEAYFRITNDIDDVSHGKQQVVFKIIPKKLDKVGNILIDEVLTRASNHGYPFTFLEEEDASKLWFALAEPDGSIVVAKESELGIEHVNFYEYELKKDSFMGTGSFQKVAFEPRIGAQYSSLHDLNNTIIIARFVAGIEGNAYLDRVDLNLRTNAGLATLSFPSKQIKNNKTAVSPVRYVGLVLGENEFNKRVN
ncbi:hypothetical protein [Motiliproteus sp. MSK22-1]|uniref:hypothetical protein n=1 Tax=Motiliproteus sp. MSK22-1 TaxID=1897630 RepID=UPI00097898B3|nr:hypothetical protein [Motiliproteus sp. MSK22-1]OMH33544.1 hypothetical protein BGP75_10940 [Motiliproteus sp. MSK22-1]